VNKNVNNIKMLDWNKLKIKQRVIRLANGKGNKKHLGVHANSCKKKKSFQEACELVPHLGLVVG
jgi:hypothetical protein